MKKIEFLLNIPEESSFVKFCTGLVRTGGDYVSTMHIIDKVNVDMKSILGIMSLCLCNGRKIIIEIDGLDEGMAYERIQDYVSSFCG